MNNFHSFEVNRRMLLKNLLENQKENDKIAVIYGQKSISYKEIHHMVLTAASNLKPKSENDYCIGLFLHNSINYIVAYFSISYAGKVIVPIDPRSKQSELISTIEYCELKVIAADSKSIALLRKFLKDYTYEIMLFNIDNMSFERVGGIATLPNSDGNELHLCCIHQVP